jgi:hypothetical protein
MVVEITVRNATGAAVGTRNVTIPAGSFMHYQFAVGEILQAGSALTLGSVDFRVVQGEGAVVPYASIVDNATSYATYVMGQFPEPTVTTSTSSRISSSVFRNLIQRGSVR